MINPNAPAFPCEANVVKNAGTRLVNGVEAMPGITIRTASTLLNGAELLGKYGAEMPVSQIATLAVSLADALIAELNKPQETGPC